jgi:site-specific DNA-methyltransferase (adenine-specific)/adenine-specific DNA-methyltransferase
MPTLNWIGKDAVINHHHEVKFRLLKDVPEHGSGDPGTGNLIVEGDNLEALKALLPYYAGQVKCIYIDPPYNTGNEGWVYNDNVKSPLITEWLGKVVGKEGETLDRHDRWLCMMYPRLALLKEFLREDGSIFISLDDNEIQALRYVMDEIFGAQNFVAVLCWQKIFTVKNSAKHFSDMHDYVVVYAKSKDSWLPNLAARTNEADANYTNVDNDPRGLWTSNALQSRNFYSKGTYRIECPGGRVVEGPPAGTFWRMEESKFWELDRDNRVWWGNSKNNSPRIKKFLSEAKQGMVPTTWWTHEFAGTNSGAKTELRSIMGDLPSFMTPKPPELIERILQIATRPGDLVLDSFAGSGTTGHAVLKMNAAQEGSAGTPARSDDGGEAAEMNEADKSVRAPLDGAPLRRFILVEMEPTIAKTITAERVKRVAEGYTNAKGEAVPGLGGGFRYCQLGEPLFDEAGQIRTTVKFGELARHVWFTETGEPLPRERVMNTPLLGVHRGTAIYLLYNGILGDKSAQGGNVLTRAILAELPTFDGPKVIYAAGCLLGPDRLSAYQITVRQTPYEIRTA